MRLNRNLYILRESPHTGNKLLFKHLKKGLKEEKVALCVFKGKKQIVTYYVIDLIFFSKSIGSFHTIYKAL